MEPELKDQVKTWEKALSPDVAKRLFIRNLAIEAYKSGDISSATENATKEIIDLMVSNMTKDQIGMHIANLEKARALLGSLTQGFQVAFTEEKEPEFKAKHDKEERERKAKSSKPKTLEDSLKNLGLDLNSLMSEINKKDPNKVTSKLGISPESQSSKANPAPVISSSSSNSEKPILSAGKFECSKCKKVLFEAMRSIHKC